MEDLYQVLGVPRTATPDEIGAAYRKLARQHHPDLNPGKPEAEDRFKQVAAAYGVLSDPDKRKAYDEFGADSLRTGFDPEQARTYQQWKQRRSASQQPSQPADFDFDLSDLFGGGLGRDTLRNARRGSDLLAVVELDLAQAIEGAEVSLEVPSTEPCSACRASGQDPQKSAQPCAECSGTGRQQIAGGPMRFVAACPACQGRGASAPPCPRCAGRGHLQTRRTTTVRIPPGADDGSTLRIAGKGAPGSNHGPAGDLVIETRVRPHPWIRREGLDLHLKLPVSLDEAYNGARVEVPTFGGGVRLRIPRGSQPGTRLRVRDKGVKRGRKRGDLYVELDVRLPEQDIEQLAEVIHRSDSGYASRLREEVRL